MILIVALIVRCSDRFCCSSRQYNGTLSHDCFIAQLDTFDFEMSYLDRFEDFFSTLASSKSQNHSAILKIDLAPPVVVIDEPGTKTSTHKTYSNLLDHDYIVAPFMEQIEKDLEEESEDEDDDTYLDAPDYPSDVVHEYDSDSTLPVDVYTSPGKHFPRFSGDAETYSISFRNKTHTSNLSDTTIAPSVSNDECSRWSVHTVYTCKDSLVSNESRSSSDLPEEAEPWKRHRGGSTVSKTSTRSLLRDLGPDTRSREEIFSKGVPWGFRGRDYIPPLLKSHKLRETMRGMPVEHNRRLVIKVKGLFRRRKE